MLYSIICFIFLFFLISFIKFQLGYPLHFTGCFIGLHRSCFKNNININCHTGTGYIIQKIRFKDERNIFLKLNLLGTGDISILILDKNKNIVIDFENKTCTKMFKFKPYENYYLKFKYKDFSGKLTLNWC